MQNKFKNLDGKKILLIVEALALLASLLLFLFPKAHYSFPAESFSYEKGVMLDSLLTMDEPGIYIDNSIASAEEKATIVTPVSNLHPGSYDIYIKYLTNDNNNTFTASSDYNTYPVITQRSNTSLGTNDETAAPKVIRLLTWQKVEGYQISFIFSGNGYVYASGLEIVETNYWKVIVLLCVILAIFVINLFIYLKEKMDEKELFGYLYAIGLAFVASLPVLGVFFFTGHDASYHLGRLEALAEGLAQGSIPLRVSNFWLDGLGYASALFYCDIFLYPSAILRNLGASMQGAWKVYIVLVNLSTALIGFYSFRRIMKSRVGAMVSLTLYVLAAYRLNCMYVRFSVGDYSAQVFLPLVLYGIIHIYEDHEGEYSLFDNFKRSLPFVFGVSGLVLTHIQSTLMTAIFVFAFALINLKKTISKNVITRLFLSLAGVLVLNMWFIFPFFEMSGSLAVMTEAGTEGRYRGNGTLLWQLFSLFPQGGGDSYAVQDSFGNNFHGEMPFTNGPAAIGVMLYLILRLSRMIKRDGSVSESVAYKVKKADKLLIGALMAMFMTTIYFPWDFVEQLTPATGLITQTLMCPWRWLGIAGTISCALCGVVYEIILEDKEKLSRYATGFAAVIVTISALGASYYMTTRGDSGAWSYLYDEGSFESFSIIGGEYLPAGAVEESFDVTYPVASEGVEVSDFVRSGKELKMTVSDTDGAEGFVDMPLFYYKGYRVADASGKNLKVTEGDLALVRAIIPAGFSGDITVCYKEPLYWRFYELVSVLSVIGLVVMAVLGKKKVGGNNA